MASGSSTVAAIEYYRLSPSIIREEWSEGAHIWPTDLPCFLVKVTDQSGRYGIGEATSQPWYLGETAPQIASVLDLIGPRLIGHDASNFLALHVIMANAYAGKIPGGRSARAGIDMAIVDLVGKQRDLPAYMLFGGAYRTRFELLHNLYNRPPAAMAEACQASVAAGVRALKIKVGDLLLIEGWSRDGLRREAALLEAALDAVPRDVAIDADANQSWETPEHTLAVLGSFQSAPNLSIEQPLGFADLIGAAYVRSRGRTPMVLDESVWGVEAMASIIRLGACDRIVLKINRVGGMLPAAQIIGIAEAAGIGVSLDTNPFTIVGDTASAHLGAIARYPNPIECDGHQSFITFGEEDPFIGGVKIRGGIAELPESPGLGVDVNWQLLGRHVQSSAASGVDRGFTAIAWR